MELFHYIHKLFKANESIDEIVEEISKSASTQTKNDSEKSNLKSVISNNVNPLYYRLKIHPYLNDNSDKKFSFEGHVTIVFQITGSPTKTIILNAKNLDIPDTDVSLTYSSTSLLEPQSASQVLEEDIDTFVPPEIGALQVEDTTTTISPIDATTFKENVETIAPPEDFTTSLPLLSDNDAITTSLPPIEIPQNDAPNDDTISTENEVSKNEEETTTTTPDDNQKTRKSEVTNTNETESSKEVKDSPSSTEYNNEPTMSSSDDTPISIPATNISSSTEKNNRASELSDITQTPKDEKSSDNEDPVPVDDTITTITPTISSTTDSTVVKVAEKNNVQTVKKNYNQEDGTYLIKTKLPLETGVNYTLVMKYTGKITDKLGGLYRTSYKKDNATM